MKKKPQKTENEKQAGKPAIPGSRPKKYSSSENKPKKYSSSENKPKKYSSSENKPKKYSNIIEKQQPMAMALLL